MKIKSDIQIAQEAQMQPIASIAEKAGIPADSLEPYGRTKAKVDNNLLDSLQDRPNGKLILDRHFAHASGRGENDDQCRAGGCVWKIGEKSDAVPA